MLVHNKFEAQIGQRKLVISHHCEIQGIHVVQAAWDGKRSWCETYEDSNAAQTRFVLGVVDELRRQGMPQATWEKQLVNQTKHLPPPMTAVSGPVR